jgi:hypothetical protein
MEVKNDTDYEVVYSVNDGGQPVGPFRHMLRILWRLAGLSRGCGKKPKKQETHTPQCGTLARNHLRGTALDPKGSQSLVDSCVPPSEKRRVYPKSPGSYALAPY